MTDKEKIFHLETLVAELEQKLSLALGLLAKQGIKKDSSNSHQPRSKDFPKRTVSLRKPSEKKSGGQPGHKGSNLKMSACPDEIKELKPSFCSNCGSSFSP
jgi:transposase